VRVVTYPLSISSVFKVELAEVNTGIRNLGYSWQR
jgi:hypothetical protein